MIFLILLAALFAAMPAQAQQFDQSLFQGLKWRLIGPYRGGRALAVAGIPGNPDVYYFGAVSGGVWKSTNGGTMWAPMFDREAVSSIGAIAVAESDPNIVYVGTGEACIRGNISHGDGVYKSLDGGQTWKNVGLRDSRHIGRVIVHPRNPDIVLVAALGHVYGPNAERGVFRTTDGGKSWEKVLYKDENTGAIDLAFDPSNPNVVFAALWQASRTAWSLTSGGPGSGLYKSTDGGATWNRLEGQGLPKGILGRIGVSVSAANPERVYALIEAEEGGLYRSDDAGKTWQRVSDDHRLRERPWYYMHVIADPKSADTVYVADVGFYRSVDGGRSFTPIFTPHGDHHALWIDPKNPQRMINGNDGGVDITVDGGKTWTQEDNQPTAQFYHVAVDNRFPYYVYGAQQDNSTVAIASRSDHGFIDKPDWYPVAGGESGFVVPYPPDPNIVYAGSYDGLITRFDKRTGQAQNITAWPDNPMGHGAATLKHRFQWTAPILISPHDPNVLYHAAEVLFKTTDAGKSWTAISPDLTRNDKSKQGPSGGPLTKDNTSVEYYDVIFALAESPFEKDLLWAGTDDGLVHVTRDGGKHWSNVTPKEMPEWSMVSLIEASPHNASAAYLAVDRHRLDDYRPYIYRTRDLGKTWTKITAGIPENTFVHAVREDPKRPGLLYAGTETGVFVSFDDGARWQPLQLNLPTSPIHDLAVKDDDLVVATHGRSFWILDDISPLRQLSEQVAGGEVHLFTPRLAYRVRSGFQFGRRAPAPVADNPPAGAIIYYYLKSAAAGGAGPRDEITLEILDRQGKALRKFSSRAPERPAAPEEEESPLEAEQRRRERLETEAGMHRFMWDLRYESPPRVAGAASWGGPGRGPLALPGAYQVKLTVTGKTYTAPLEIKPDPRLSTSPADLEKQFDLMMKIRGQVEQAHRAVNQIRDLRSQLEALRKRNPDAKTLSAAAEELEKKLAPVEEELIQVKSKSSEDPLNYPIKLNNKLTLLAGVVESADAAPTEASYEVFNVLSGQLETQLARWKEISTGGVAAFNELVRKENVPAVNLRR